MLNIVDEGELEGLILAYSPKFQALLSAARQEIRTTGGIPHEEFWRQVDAEYAEVPVPPKGRARRTGNLRSRQKAALQKGSTKKAPSAVVK